MIEQSRNEGLESSQVCFETLEAFARMKVQEFLQQVLEEEVSALLGRGKHGRGAGSTAGARGSRRWIRQAGAAMAMPSHGGLRC